MNTIKKYLHPRICIFVILLSGWCRTRMRSFATDVICFFEHYLHADIHIYETEKNNVVIIEYVYLF